MTNKNFKMAFFIFLFLTFISFGLYIKFSNTEYGKYVEGLTIISMGIMLSIYFFIDGKEIKSLETNKKINSFKLYESSDYKNRRLIQTFSEMISVFIEEYKISKNKKVAAKKSFSILKRDLSEIFKFIAFIAGGFILALAILLGILIIGTKL